MGINQFPKYELQFKEISLNIADKYGFDSVAFATYQTQTNKNMLVVSTNLKLTKHVYFMSLHIYTIRTDMLKAIRQDMRVCPVLQNIMHHK